MSDLSPDALKLLLIITDRGTVWLDEFESVLGRYYDNDLFSELFREGYLDSTCLVKEECENGTAFSYGFLRASEEGILLAKKHRGSVRRKVLEFLFGIVKKLLIP